MTWGRSEWHSPYCHSGEAHLLSSWGARTVLPETSCKHLLTFRLTIDISVDLGILLMKISITIIISVVYTIYN